MAPNEDLAPAQRPSVPIWPQSHQSTECSFAKKLASPSKGSIVGVELLSSQQINIESKFVHKSVDALLADHGCKVALSGAPLDLLIKRLIELIEVLKKTLNAFGMRAEAVSDQISHCDSEPERQELLKIFAKLRIVIHWENFVIQRLVLTRQLLLEVYAQCRNVEGRLKRRSQQKVDVDDSF